MILTRPAPELAQLGFVKPRTLYQVHQGMLWLEGSSTDAAMGRSYRDKTLTSFVFKTVDDDDYNLRQSTYNPRIFGLLFKCSMPFDSQKDSVARRQ